jgi:hypothetical protein
VLPKLSSVFCEVLHSCALAHALARSRARSRSQRFYPPPPFLPPFLLQTPRIIFLACCIAYGTNFALGRSMNEALAPSVVSGLRFSLAALALSPFLRQMRAELVKESIFMSTFIAAGYIGQSISLQTIEAGKAGFICSLSVIVCPLLETIFDNKQVTGGLVAAILLSVSGVATLELTGNTAPALGDLFALAQPVGFGVGYYLTEKMMRKNPDMTIPITAVQTAVVGVCAITWMVAEGAAGGHLTDGSLFDNIWADPKVSSRDSSWRHGGGEGRRGRAEGEEGGEAECKERGEKRMSGRGGGEKGLGGRRGGKERLSRGSRAPLRSQTALAQNISPCCPCPPMPPHPLPLSLCLCRERRCAHQPP